MPSLLPGLKRSASQRPVSGIDQDLNSTDLLAPGGGLEDDLDTVDGEQVTAAKPDNQTLLKLLEEGEQVRREINEAILTGNCSGVETAPGVTWL